MQPVIIPRFSHTISRKWISPHALRVLYRLKEQGYLAYLVGGSVRDLLLGREPKDFDIATDATPNEVKKTFRNCRLIGRRFRLAHIHFHDEIIEVATFRALASEAPEEETVPDLVHPSEALPTAGQPGFQKILPSSAATGGESRVSVPEPVSPPVQTAGAAVKTRAPRLLKTEDGMILRDNVWGTPEEDALRRDFTVNALFYNIADFSVIDYVGGMEDLRRGLIRIIGDPEVRFTEDPVRMVRAVRFAAMLGFEVEEQTLRALLDMKERVALASPSRMYEEVQKLLLLGEGEKIFQMLRKTGLFGVIFPRINEWLDTEEDGFPHIRAGKALEWVDACVHAGRRVEPQVLFALMFGQYIEEKAAAFRNQGAAPLEALDKAVAEFLGEHVPRVQIPRKVGLAVRDIIWNQTRFEKTAGKVPFYFIRRPGFADAYEYLRFTSELTGERRELRAWWKEFLKSHPPVPAGGKQEKQEHGRKAHGRPERPSRRRRRRGPRRPEGQKPKP
jgi:poly(A) polymerase